MIQKDLQDALAYCMRDKLYCVIPHPTIESLHRYVYHHIAPGGFVTTALCNNFAEAVQRADSWNTQALKAIVTYMYMELPSSCWGNASVVNNWLSLGSTTPL